MEKIKNYFTSLDKRKLIIYSLVTALLIGGGIYLYKVYFSDNNSSKAILTVIPKESAFVMSFTPVNFLAKMEVEDMMKTELGEKTEKFSKKRDWDVLEDLFKDPSISGINLLSEVFVFHSYEDIEEHYFCVSAGVENDKKFGEFLEVLSKEMGDKIKIKEEDDFYYFTEETIGIVWDDDKFIFMVGTTDEDDLENHMEKLMTLEEDEMIISNEDFITFYENKKDISIWTSTELLDEFVDEFRDDLISMERELGISLDDIIDMYDDCISTTHIEFGNGEIICSGEFIPNENLQDIQKELYQEFNGEILEFIPENNLLLLSGAINIDAYYDLIKKMINDDLIEEIEEFEREMRNEIGLNIDDMLNTFGGSFIVNITGFEEIQTTTREYDRYYNDSLYRYYDYNYDEYYYEGGWTYGDILKDTTLTLPLFSVIFDMRDSEFLERMIEEGLKENALTYSSYDGYYSIDAEMDIFLCTI